MLLLELTGNGGEGSATPAAGSWSDGVHSDQEGPGDDGFCLDGREVAVDGSQEKLTPVIGRSELSGHSRHERLDEHVIRRQYALLFVAKVLVELVRGDIGPPGDLGDGGARVAL